jgi:hypothetical protein
MAFSPLQNATFRDKVLDATPLALASGLTIYGLTVDNRANTSDVFVKVYDGAPTVGTTNPESWVRAEASKKQDFVFYGATGLPITGAANFVCVTTGGTAGTTPPTNDVRVDIYTD